jgi:murein L,D-transpeptidase YcbB/YkuD
MSSTKKLEERKRPEKHAGAIRPVLKIATAHNQNWSGRLHLRFASDWHFLYILLAAFLLVLVFLGGVIYRMNSGDARTSNPEKSSALQLLTPEGQLLLSEIIKSGNLPELQGRNFKNIQEQVRELYQSTPGVLIWVSGSRPTPQAIALAKQLKSADEEGLDPADYDGSYWDAAIATFSGGSPLQESALLRFDVALTVSAIRFVSDLRFGRVKPYSFGIESAKNRVNSDVTELIRTQLVNSQDIKHAIKELEPPFPAYQRTIVALRQYRDLALQDNGEQLTTPRTPVKPGDSYADLPRLINLLVLLGDLPKSERIRSSQFIYERDVVDAVKRFQSRHGLEPNGILDFLTLRELKTPLAQRIEQLQLTLERLRWVPPQSEPPMLVVNIPEFRLRAVDEDYRWALFMKVVVGKAYRRQTPVFAADLKSVIFRPYWNVPLSITRSEILPHIQKDSSYISRQSYQVVNAAGEVVTKGPVNESILEMLHSGQLRIRQIPGPQNALGLVKFDFPNVHDVYMHGTPSTELFTRSRRDFSHGCIRVEDPVALAVWLLRNRKEWTPDRIRTAMFGSKTFRVELQRPIPVLIVYGTAVVMENGEVRFFRDIYHQDSVLAEALALHTRSQK